MAIYGAVRLDKVAAIAGGIESVKHSVRLENGMIHHVAGLASGEREVKSVATPLIKRSLGSTSSAPST